MKNIFVRSISGVFLIITVLGAVYWNSVSNFLLFGLILTIGQWEFYKLVGTGGRKPNRSIGIGLGVFIYTLSYLIAANVLSARFFYLLMPFFLVLLITELYSKKDQPITHIGLTLLGVLYIAVPLSTVHFMVLNSGLASEQTDLISELSAISPFGTDVAEITYANFILIGFFVIQWVSDTGAYLFGMSFGKHRLFERISPKKSWEGAIGGFLASIGVSFLMHYIYPQLSLTSWIIISLIITLFGIYGDLFESLIKRSVNIKDSGNILPGHGGILDRFDSSLMALPMVCFYLQFICYF